MILESDIGDDLISESCPVRFRSILAERRETLFAAAFFLYVMARGMELLSFSGWSAGFADSLIGVIQVLVVVVLVVIIVAGHARRPTAYYVVLGAYTAITVVVSLVSSTYEFVWLLLFVLAGRGIPLRKIAVCALLAGLLTLLLAFITLAIGVTEMTSVLRADGGLRLGFGFYHPNRVMQILLMVMIALLTIWFGTKKGYVASVLCLLVVILAFFFTDSRTGLLAAVGAVLIFGFFGIFKNYLEIGRACKAIGIVLIILVVVNIASVLFYSADSPLLVFLNEALSGRLLLPSLLIDAGALQPFGFDNSGSSALISDVISLSSANVPLDNAYVHVLIVCGPIALAFYVVALIAPLFGKKIHERVDPKLLAGITLCAVIGVAESYVIDVAFNFFLIAYGGIVLDTLIARFEQLPIRRKDLRKF